MSLHRSKRRIAVLSMMLIGACLLVSACSSTRNFYEAVYNTLQLRAKAANPPDDASFPGGSVSYQRYEAERKMLLEPRDKSAKRPP